MAENNMLGVVPLGYEMQRYADMEIPKWKTAFTKAVAVCVNSPSSFFIVPADFWIGEETTMDLVRKAYEAPLTRDERSQKFLTPMAVKVGMYVALIYDGEWHRGRVLSVDLEDEKPFLVRLIDFGEAVKATSRELSRLLKRCGLGELMYEAAVECQLILPCFTGMQPSPGTIAPHSSWECVQRLTFKRLLFDRELHYTIFGKFVNDFGETVWQVTLNIPEETGQSTIALKFRYPKGPQLLDGSHPVPPKRAYNPGDIFYALDDALHHCLRMARPRYQFVYPLDKEEDEEPKESVPEKPKKPEETFQQKLERWNNLILEEQKRKKSRPEELTELLTMIQPQITKKETKKTETKKTL